MGIIRPALIATDQNPLEGIPPELRQKYSVPAPQEWLDHQLEKRWNKYNAPYKPPEHVTLSGFFQWCAKAHTGLILKQYQPDPYQFDPDMELKMIGGDWVHGQVQKAAVEAGLASPAGVELVLPDGPIDGRVDILTSQNELVELKTVDTRGTAYVDFKSDKWGSQMVLADHILQPLRTYIISINREGDWFSPVKIWKLYRSDHAINRALGVLEEINGYIEMGKVAPARPSAQGCKYCPIKAQCAESWVK